MDNHIKMRKAMKDTPGGDWIQETVGLDILRKAKIEMDSDIFKRR